MSDGSFGIVSNQNGHHITYLMSNRVILLKSLISPLPMPLGVQYVKTCKKSWPGSLVQLLHLTFIPCFKVKWGVIILKHPYISLVIGARASKYKSSPWEVLACNCFACEQFWPHFEKLFGRHSQLFHNH